MSTNLEVIKNFSLEEEVEFLSKVVVDFWAPWLSWFDSQHCSNCSSNQTFFSETGEEFHLTPCEVEDGYCPILKEEVLTKPIIRLWLSSESNLSETN